MKNPNAIALLAQGQPLGYKLWDFGHFNDAAQRASFQAQPAAHLLRDNVVTGATMAFRATLKELILFISLL